MKDIIESAQKGICQEFLDEMKKAKTIKPFVRMFLIMMTGPENMIFQN